LQATGQCRISRRPDPATDAVKLARKQISVILSDNADKVHVHATESVAGKVRRDELGIAVADERTGAIPLGVITIAERQLPKVGRKGALHLYCLLLHGVDFQLAEAAQQHEGPNDCTGAQRGGHHYSQKRQGPP
jgi:hypothetical protein